MLIFRQSRRFAAYHEQGQAPAPHAKTLFRLPKHSTRARRVAQLVAHHFHISGSLKPINAVIRRNGDS